MTNHLMTDPNYLELADAANRIGDELDSATDGALHHAYPADVADRMLASLQYRYAEAVKARNVYASTN